MLQISQVDFDSLVTDFKWHWEWADSKGLTGQRVSFALLCVLDELGVRVSEEN